MLFWSVHLLAGACTCRVGRSTAVTHIKETFVLNLDKRSCVRARCEMNRTGARGDVFLNSSMHTDTNTCKLRFVCTYCMYNTHTPSLSQSTLVTPTQTPHSLDTHCALAIRAREPSLINMQSIIHTFVFSVSSPLADRCWLLILDVKASEKGQKCVIETHEEIKRFCGGDYFLEFHWKYAK